MPYQSFAEAETKLLDVLNDESGDNCSLTAVFYGFEDYSEIKEFLKGRFEALNSYKNTFSESYWNRVYKENYYRYNRLRSEQVAGN